MPLVKSPDHSLLRLIGAFVECTKNGRAEAAALI